MPAAKQNFFLYAIRSPVLFRLSLLLAIMPWLTRMSAAATITGKVMNLSRHQPSPGDDIVLYRVDQSMHEVGRTKSNARGAFRFEGRELSRYLVAAVHQKVSYHTGLLSGADPVDVSVYDSASKLTGLEEGSRTFFPRAEGDVLKITEFFVVLNQSKPPRTLSAKQTFTFLLPRGAVLESTAVQPPETLPFVVTASSCGVPDQYCIAYPIRPGSTKIRALYHLPYTGSVSITAPVLHPVNEVAWMVPKTLRFEANVPGVFMERGQASGLSMYWARSVRPGQSLAFSLAGTNLVNKGTAGTARAALSGFSVGAIAGSSDPGRNPTHSAGRRQLLWTMLTGALVTVVFLMALFRKAIRVPV